MSVIRYVTYGSVHDIPEDVLRQCWALFNEHYGTWSRNAGKAIVGKPIQMRFSRYVQQFAWNKDQCHLTIAYEQLPNEDRKVVGHAFSFHDVSDRRSAATTTWIMQLIVHPDVRRRGIATQLIRLAKKQDDVCLLIASANPLALMAARRAAGVPFETRLMGNLIPQLLPSGSAYLDKCFADVEACSINTHFHVDKTQADRLREDLYDKQLFPFGPLEPGHEYLGWFILLPNSKQPRYDFGRILSERDIRVLSGPTVEECLLTSRQDRLMLSILSYYFRRSILPVYGSFPVLLRFQNSQRIQRSLANEKQPLPPVPPVYKYYVTLSSNAYADEKSNSVVEYATNDLFHISFFVYEKFKASPSMTINTYGLFDGYHKWATAAIPWGPNMSEAVCKGVLQFDAYQGPETEPSERLLASIRKHEASL